MDINIEIVVDSDCGSVVPFCFSTMPMSRASMSGCTIFTKLIVPDDVIGRFDLHVTHSSVICN